MSRISPTFTTFDRAAMPSNLLTVQEWNHFGRAVGRATWEGAARYWASLKGGALVWRADDRLVVFTKREDGNISRKTYRPQTWGWA